MGYKRPFTLFLCLVLLLYLLIAPFFLFSIDRGRLEGRELEDSTKWQGVITLWDIPRSTISGSAFGWIKTRISKFENENPGVFINLRELNTDNSKEILQRAAKANSENRPDVLPLFIGNNTIPLANIEPLNMWINEETWGKFKEEYKQAVSYKEDIYGLPFASSGNILLINRDLLQSCNCNMPQKYEWSYEEFIEFIDEVEGAKNQEGVLTFDAYVGLGEGSVIPILLSDGGQLYQQDQQRFAFYQPEMVSGLQKLLNIKNKASTHEEFGFREKSEVYRDFLEDQKTLILAADSSIIYTLERLKKQGEGFSYVVMPYPKGNMDIPIWFSHQISAYAMMKNDDREKQKMIYRFLEYLIQEESQRSLSKLGAFTVVNSIRDKDEEVEFFEDLLNIGYEYQTHPLHPKWESIEGEIVKSIQSVLGGEKTPTQAFKDLQGILDNIE